MKPIFEEIKRRVRLGEWLTKNYGMEFKQGMALCPLHQDKATRSFHLINDERWYCFGCGFGGDVIEFVQKKENLNLMDAVRRLATDLGIKMSAEEEARIRAFKDLQDRNSRMLTRAAKELHEDMTAETYLQSRGISDEAVKHFGFGYRADANAISIPIHDRYNRLVGYSLRLISPKDDEPKYKNSKADDLGLFQKREILYNLGACRADIKKCVHIVEGYFDVVAMWQMGFKNTIGICQAIMTKEQAKILNEAIAPETEIVLVPDGDKPGLDALAKNVAMLRAYSKERSIKATLLSTGKDASEAYQKAPVTAKADVQNAKPAEEFICDTIIKTETDKAKQYQLVKPVAMAVSPLLRDDLVDHLAKTWNKDRRILASYLGTEIKDADASAFNGPVELSESYFEYVRHVHAHGVKFNIPSMDRFIRRIAPGETCYLQARTSVGKTALLLNFLAKFSKQNIPCLFFSLEQQKEQIFERMMQISNRLPGHEIERMTLTTDGRLNDCHENYYQMFKNIHVIDKPSMTLAQIKEHIVQFGAINKFPTVVAIDYFGYIKCPGKSDVYEATSQLAKDIKACAKEMNNIWVVLHQLSRAGGSGGEPVTLDMGRDTGVLEESADQLIGAWRPELAKDITDEERLKREAESALMLAVLKNRSGPTGLAKFIFDRKTLIVTEFDDHMRSMNVSLNPPQPQARQDNLPIS